MHERSDLHMPTATDPHGLEGLVHLLERPCAHYLGVLRRRAGMWRVVILALRYRICACVLFSVRALPFAILRGREEQAGLDGVIWVQGEEES